MSHRCGFVAVIGRPNVGKSTLLNRLVGQKVSITSRKAQTTRHAVIGIISTDEAQVVLVDTPGFQTKHGGQLNKALNRAVTDSLADVDVVLFVVEATRLGDRDRQVLDLIPSAVPVIAVVNKVDLLARRDLILPFIDGLRQWRDFAAVVPVSAEKGVQVDDLLVAIVPMLPEGPALFDEEQVTDRSERFIASELVREKLFRFTGDELPYGINVVVDQFETEGNLRRIRCNVIVSRDSHKGMVIGAGGENLKRVATEARLDMERTFGGTVFLELHVRVDANWIEDPRRLRKYGYV
jgi:GTPase